MRQGSEIRNSNRTLMLVFNFQKILMTSIFSQKALHFNSRLCFLGHLVFSTVPHAPINLKL